jgi:hypothetical protein
LKAIKVDDEAYQKLEELSKKTGQSIKDLATRAILLLYAGQQHEQIDKEVESVSEKLIVLKYPAKCSICKRELNAGDVALYVKYTFTDQTTKTAIICPECEKSDTTLAKLYLKKREIERTVKALEKQARELADKLIDLSKLQQLINKYDALLYEVQKKYEELVKNPASSVEVVNAMDRLRRELYQAWQEVGFLKEVIPRRLRELEEKSEPRERAEERQAFYRKWTRR